MAGEKFNSRHKEVLDSMLLKIPGIKPGKMFGYPGYYINGKLFACVYEHGVSLKVPNEVRDQLLAEKGIELFVPMENRPMKQWVIITKKDSKDYLNYEKAFLSSIEFVLSEKKKSKK